MVEILEGATLEETIEKMQVGNIHHHVEKKPTGKKSNEKNASEKWKENNM